MPKKSSRSPQAPEIVPSPLTREEEDDLEPTEERPAVGRRQRASAAKPQSKPASEPQRKPESERQPEAAPEGGGAERIGIELLNGPDDGTITTFEQPVVLLGRDPDPTHPELKLSDEQRQRIGLLAIASDPRLSRTHLALVFHDSHWWALDLKSTNGSFLGYRRERLVGGEHELALGQLIFVGDSSLRLVAPADQQPDQPNQPNQP